VEMLDGEAQSAKELPIRPVASGSTAGEIWAMHASSMSRHRKLLRAGGLLSGVLLSGTMGGAQSWEPLKAETTASFRGLFVVDDRVVWASGTRGTAISTSDGGNTWRVDSIPGAGTMDLRAIHARSAQVAHVAATAGRIWRTTDGGRSWSLRYQSADTSMFLDAIAFFDDRHGMALGDPMRGRFVILVTRDGGDTWAEAQEGSRPEASDGEAAFAASGTSLVLMKDRFGWLGTGGSVARVFRTIDAGATWSVAPSAIPARAGTGGVFSVAFADTLHGVVVGGDYERPDSSPGTAAFTTDGGVTWTPAAAFPRGYRSGVAIRRAVPDRVIAIAVGTTGSDVSRDGGRTWTPLDGTAFNAVQFAPSGTAFAVGGRGRVARLSIR
jgi:photosystem II stability/assembly factor-like uncharacterized protein